MRTAATLHRLLERIAGEKTEADRPEGERPVDNAEPQSEPTAVNL